MYGSSAQDYTTEYPHGVDDNNQVDEGVDEPDTETDGNSDVDQPDEEEHNDLESGDDKSPMKNTTQHSDQGNGQI